MVSQGRGNRRRRESSGKLRRHAHHHQSRSRSRCSSRLHIASTPRPPRLSAAASSTAPAASSTTAPSSSTARRSPPSVRPRPPCRPARPASISRARRSFPGLVNAHGHVAGDHGTADRSRRRTRATTCCASCAPTRCTASPRSSALATIRPPASSCANENATARRSRAAVRGRPRDQRRHRRGGARE